MVQDKADARDTAAEDRRRVERRNTDARLEAMETAMNGMFSHHQVLAQQMAAMVLAQDRQTAQVKKLGEDMPQVIVDGFSHALRSVVADPEVMQEAGKGLLGALSEISTRATGSVVLGWFKTFLRALVPLGLLLMAAWAVGGPSLFVKVASWWVKTFGSPGG